MNLSSLLGSLMSSSGQQPAAGQSSEDAVLQMLEQVIGHGASQAASGSAQPTGNIANNPLLGPIVDNLAQRMGISPALAETVVAFVVGQLISGKTGAPAPGTGQTSNVDPNALLQRVASGQGVDANYLHSTGMPQQLADKTGMDKQKATASLQQAIQMLGGAMSGGEQFQQRAA